MPTASRREAKQTKKITIVTQPNQHSSAAVQGLFVVSENHIKMEGGPFNGTLQDTHKVVEEESLTEDNKEVVVELEVPAADGDRKSSEIPDVDIAAINDESDKVEETEHVSESVADSPLDHPSLNHVSSPNEDTVVLELKEEKGEDFLSFEDATEGFSPVVANHGAVVEETELPPSEDNNDLSSSVSGNEMLRETEVVETEKKKDDDVLSSVVTEEPNPNEINAASSSLPSTVVVSREVVGETHSDAKSDESEEVPPKEIEKSLAKTSTYEKVGEQSGVQQSSSSYQIAKECFQPSQNIADAESNSATDQQDKTEEPRSFENSHIIVPVTQRQHTSWKSCCGLFEILRHGDR